MRAAWMEECPSRPSQANRVQPVSLIHVPDKKVQPFTDAGRIDRFAPIQEEPLSVKQGFSILQIRGKRRQRISGTAFPRRAPPPFRGLSQGHKKAPRHKPQGKNGTGRDYSSPESSSESRSSSGEEAFSCCWGAAFWACLRRDSSIMKNSAQRKARRAASRAPSVSLRGRGV